MDIKEPELASLLNIADRLKKVETALADILPLDQFIERIEKIETYISTSKEVLNLEEVCLLLNTSKSQIYRLTRLMAIPHYKPTLKKLTLSIVVFQSQRSVGVDSKPSYWCESGECKSAGEWYSACQVYRIPQ